MAATRRPATLLPVFCALALLFSTMPAWAQPTARTPRESTGPRADRVPTELLLIGGQAEELFDAAYASDWEAAAESANEMSASERRLPRLPDADVAAMLQANIRAAEQHVGSHERVGAMDDANAITLFVADLSEHYVSPRPYAATLLGYYGRELEIGIVAARPSALQRARADLDEAWSRLRPRLERQGQTEEVKRFTDIIVALDGAKRPRDFVAPTRAELAEAARIEQLFD